MSNRSVIYELVIDLSTQQWGVSCPIDQNLTGPMQYGWDRFQKDHDSMTFGGGLLAGSPLPGTRRMIFCGYSPCWEGFYVSALGGAMHIFHRVGINYVWLRGQCTQDMVLVIKHEKGEYSIGFEPVDADLIWAGYTDQTGRTWTGFYALQRALFEKYRSGFIEDSFRILTVGPGARYTKEGGIGSNQIKRGDISVIDDWAGRGGLGSRLLQQHHIAGIVFGGDWHDPALKEARELDEYFLNHFGQRAILSDLALSQKYRYVPKFETGGTFGVNMHEVEDRLFSFNYRSVVQSDDDRLTQHENLIVSHYLKQFNDEIIVPRNFDHCGEPCAIACKKFVGEFKKDYEPYEALGPNSGIFDQRAAEKINKYVDTLGLDLIQAGGTVAWIMELIADHIIPAEDFGLPPEGPRFQFAKSTDEFDLVKDSDYNAEYARAILDMILYTPSGEPFRRGMRAAAKWLDQKYKIRSIDRVVFNAHGTEGCMVPNQYWTTGVMSPMPIMGKYLNYYGIDYLPPYELGRKNVERFVYELYSENTGSCRFHRKWVEDIIDEIILSHFDLDFDFWKTNFTLAKEIHDYQSKQSVPWESERVVDIVKGFLEKWDRIGLKNQDLKEWLERFRQDKFAAAKEYWQLIMDGIDDTFQKGLSEPGHIEHGFLKK